MRKRLTSRIPLVLVVVASILIGCAGQEAPASEMEKGEIVIGIVEDLSGPVGGMGTPYAAGVTDCVRYINEEEAGVKGHSLRVVIVDNKMDSTLAIAGWERIKSEGAPVDFSCFSGAASPVLQQLCDEDRIPLIAGAGSIDQMFPKKKSFFFSVGPQLPGTIESMCQMVEKDLAKKGLSKSPKVGFDLISLGTTPQMQSKAAKLSSEKRGWEYLITRTSPQPVDVTTQVLQMKQFGCEYLYLMTTEAASVAWFKELGRQNFHPVIYGASGLSSDELWRATGDLCIGSSTNLFSVQWNETDIPLIQKLHELNTKWHPEITWRPSHYNKGFTDTIVIAETLRKIIEKNGYERLNGESMQATMETMNYEPMGLGIPYIWTATDHQGIRGVKWYQRTADGKLVPISDWIVFEPLPEEQRMQSFWLSD